MRNIRLYTLLALLLMAGVMQAQTADDFWIEVNTNGDWFHHPVGRSIDTVYVASMHGVYRSVDTCQTWQCVKTNLFIFCIFLKTMSYTLL